MQDRAAYRRVDVLDTDAVLVVTADTADVISLGTNDPATTAVRLFPERRAINAMVAVDGRGPAFVTDGDAIFRLDKSGAVAVVCRLSEEAAAPLNDDDEASVLKIGAGHGINWHLSFDAASGRFYFAVLQPRGAGFFAELEPGRRLVRLDGVAGHGAAVDAVARRVYVPRHDGALRVGDFETRALTSVQLATRAAQFARLSPNRERLALSSAVGDDDAIALVDVATGVERATTLRGRAAAWVDDDTLWYFVDENELWCCSVSAERTPGLIFAAGPPRRSRRGSFLRPPAPSSSGRFVVAGFASGYGEAAAGERARLQTVVFDREREERRVFDEWWHNVGVIE